MPNFHPVPIKLQVLAVRRPEIGLTRLYGVSVGRGGPNGRTPMVRGKDADWRQWELILEYVEWYEDRMELLRVLEEAESRLS
jgi:hypothetical protein